MDIIQLRVNAQTKTGIIEVTDNNRIRFDYGNNPRDGYEEVPPEIFENLFTQLSAHFEGGTMITGTPKEQYKTVLTNLVQGLQGIVLLLPQAETLRQMLQLDKILTNTEIADDAVISDFEMTVGELRQLVAVAEAAKMLAEMNRPTLDKLSELLVHIATSGVDGTDAIVAQLAVAMQEDSGSFLEMIAGQGAVVSVETPVVEEPVIEPEVV